MYRRKRSRFVSIRTCSIAAQLAVLLYAGVGSAQQPSILVVSPVGASSGWVDLDYLSDLRRAGFEVDYTDAMADVTWERIRHYNVLLI